MGSLLRSLSLLTAMALGGGAFAQLQYWAYVYGYVPGCTPGQVITVATSFQTVTTMVDVDCSYWAIVYTSQNQDVLTASMLCQGGVQTVTEPVVFNGALDSVLVNINLSCGGGGTPDCLGIPGGPNVPGSPCDDGDPGTTGDLWYSNCVCSGTALGGCQALFAIQQTNPWIISTTNLSTGVAPITFSWWMPDGSTSTQFEPGHVFTSTGVYAICLSITDGGGCTSTTCDTMFVDSMGFVANSFPLIDCYGVLWGSNMPGTPCDDGDPNTINDTWNPNCMCTGYSGTSDCLGIANGPNMPGTPCTDNVNGWTYSGIWNNNCVCTPVSWMDCNGVQNGPDVIGSGCDDGDPNTLFDTWDPACVCTGQTGSIDCTGLFNGPNMPGTACVDSIAGTVASGIWGSTCDCILINWVDCLGNANGPALPGTACDDGDPNTTNDIWDGYCACMGYAGTVDCLGITNGPNMPGTACTDSVNNWSYSGIWGNNCLCTPISWMDCNGVQNGPDVPGNWCDDGDPNTVGDVWDANCNCAGQGGGWVDCLGIPNGTAMPGTPCDDGDPNTFNDTWNGSCTCVGSGGLPCEADFIVTQAYDSLQGPIPGTIWVFFLNNGGQGFTYSWDFGDGTTSNVPFPTHTYSGNGPYLLCLTVSGFGCTDTFCDTVGVDANGIILPMGAQSQGFTINVMGGPNSIHEAEVLSEVAIAPNPVNDVLTLSLNSTRSGAFLVDVLDVTGKLIHQQRASLATGANTLRLDLGHLEAGPYLLRLNADGITRTERFVRGY